VSNHRHIRLIKAWWHNFIDIHVDAEAPWTIPKHVHFINIFIIDPILLDNQILIQQLLGFLFWMQKST
jgi:hypothetical protein